MIDPERVLDAVNRVLKLRYDKVASREDSAASRPGNWRRAKKDQSCPGSERGPPGMIARFRGRRGTILPRHLYRPTRPASPGGPAPQPPRSRRPSARRSCP